MARKLLVGIGVASLLVFGVAGLVALGVVRERITLVAQGASAGEERGPAPLVLLAEDLVALRRDLDAMSAALGPQVAELYASLDESASERAQAHGAAVERVASAVAALSARVDALAAATAARHSELTAALNQLRGELSSFSQVDATASLAQSAATDGQPTALQGQPTQQPDPSLSNELPSAEVAAPPAAPAPRKFLSFSLPSKGFSFAGRQRLAIVPSLSRVGFDAKSTLHDFSGVTQKVEGELEVDLARPAETPSGVVLVDARTLDTGMADRDTGLRKQLDSEHHTQLRFTWTALREAEVEPAAQRLRAIAVGRLSIKGVEREVAMPVQVSVDASQRVGIEGELVVRLRDFGVEPPSQLGMIRVENEVRVWISLRARSLGPAAAEARSEK